MKRQTVGFALVVLLCVLLTAFLVHLGEDGRRRADVEETRAACTREARFARGVLFDAVEAEFLALRSIADLPIDAKAKEAVRERMVFCVMLMKHCVAQGVVVTRERPCDGFEERTVTESWIRPYVETVSGRPEWSKRHGLIMGILVKESG
jgi:hypothetical protein